MVFDLAGLDYISSAGLRTVFRAKRAMAQRDGFVNVVNMTAPVVKVFDIVKAVPACPRSRREASLVRPPRRRDAPPLWSRAPADERHAAWP